MRQCEAMLKLYNDRYTACGATPVDKHHRLTRGRGGSILDAAGETYHVMDLCRFHHQMADGGDARASGLLIDGYVVSCTQCGLPLFTGADPYLTEKYGPEAHQSSLWGCRSLAESS